MTIQRFILLSIAIFFLAACQQEAPKPVATTKQAIAYDTTQGLNYVMNTQKVLGNNLMKAMHNGGIKLAINFCNKNAIQLTDSVAKADGYKIKRVSDLNRNPANAPNEEELAYIKKAKERMAAGKRPKPEFHKSGNSIIAYYPIVTQQMCMKCHGEPETDIPDDDMRLIKTLYPEDKATGYKENELRGIWVLEMIDNN